MTELIASITSVFTAAIGWVGTTASTIAAQPILLLACVGVPLCGLGVGLFKRLLSARAKQNRGSACARRTPPFFLLNLHFQNQR